jgi:hypothetical protein
VLPGVNRRNAWLVSRIERTIGHAMSNPISSDRSCIPLVVIVVSQLAVPRSGFRRSVSHAKAAENRPARTARPSATNASDQRSPMSRTLPTPVTRNRQPAAVSIVEARPAAIIAKRWSLTVEV